MSCISSGVPLLIANCVIVSGKTKSLGASTVFTILFCPAKNSDNACANVVFPCPGAPAISIPSACSAILPVRPVAGQGFGPVQVWAQTAKPVAKAAPPHPQRCQLRSSLAVLLGPFNVSVRRSPGLAS